MSNSQFWINHEKKIILIHSPKCACTSLQLGFIKNISKIKDKKDPRKLALAYKLIGNNKYEGIPENYMIYWGVRDPFDRIVSCYFNKFIWYNGKRLNENNLECFSKNFLIKIGIDYENLTFNKFLYAIQDLICKKQYINNHFNSQVNLKNYIKIKNNPNLFVFDINNIPEIFGNYIENSTKKPVNPVLRDLCDVKVQDIKIDELVKKNFINSKELIKKIFKDDYQIFEKYNIIY